MNKNSEVTMIGGSDGPTCVFLAKKHKERNLLRRIQHSIRNWNHKHKRSRICAKLTARPHSLKQVCSYIIKRYHALERNESDSGYQDAYRSLRAWLVQRYRPELLGEQLMDFRPKYDRNEEEIKAYVERCMDYEKRAGEITNEQFPMKFHLFQIHIRDCGDLEIIMDLTHDFMGISCSGDRKKMRYLKQIMKEIYLYYGVTEQDITNQTERMKELVTILMD